MIFYITNDKLLSGFYAHLLLLIPLHRSEDQVHPRRVSELV